MDLIKNTIARIPRWSGYVLLGVIIAGLIVYFAWVVLVFGKS